jgi:hypothetical protein
MKRLPLLSSALIFVVASLVGCDGDSASLHFDTPQDAYTAFADATKHEDWITATKALNHDSQAMMASSMILGASIMAGADEDQNQALKTLLAKHGIDMDAEPEPPADPENYDPKAAMMSVVEPVEHLPTFIGEVTAWMKSTGKESPGGMAEMRELSEVKVNGETALATCETDMGPQPVGFVKQNGGWLVDLTVEPSPEEMQQSGLDSGESDDDLPSLGAIFYGDEEIELKHVMAYRSKFFDDSCIDVVLTARPVHDREMNKLKRLLKEEGSAMGFFARGPNVRLSIGTDGELLDVFAWIDNVSMGLTPNTEIDIQIDDNRIQGSVESVTPKTIEERDRDFEFGAEFDVELLQID